MQMWDLDNETLEKLMAEKSKHAKLRVLREALPNESQGSIAELLYGIDTPITRSRLNFLERYDDCYKHKEKK